MEILYTITSYPPAIGGAQLHTHKTAIELDSRHQVSVISQWDTNRTDWLLGTTLRAPSESRKYTEDGIQVTRIGLSLGDKVRLIPPVTAYYAFQGLSIRTIAQVLAGKIEPLVHSADVVHNGRIGREPISFASKLVAERLGSPFFLTTYHHPRWRGWFFRHFRRLYRNADGVIALTNAEKAHLSQLGVDERKIFVTGMGPVLAGTADAGSFALERTDTGPVVLFIGQHYRYKGFLQLLEAADYVWDQVPETRFVFVGPPVGNSERKFAKMDDKRIIRLGLVDLQTKTNAIAACTLLCVPSTQESFGGVYTEAWMFEKPVIGCDIPAVREVIDDGVNGFLVKQDPREIADRICHLLLNPTIAERMGLAGRKKVLENYTWDRIAARTEEAYITVLRNG